MLSPIRSTLHTVTAPFLRIGLVTQAIEAPESAVKNWIRDGYVKSRTSGEGGWHLFSFDDLALLALVRVIVSYGFPVAFASRVAADVLLRAPRSDIPSFAHALRAANYALLIWKQRVDGKDTFMIRIDPIDGARRARPPACVVIDVAAVVIAAFVRAELIADGEHELEVDVPK